MITNTDNIAQAKILRVLHITIYLMRGHRSIEDIAARFHVSPRTAYRYLNLIDELDFGIEQDFEGNFYIVDFDDCPLCGEKHKSRETVLSKRASRTVHSSPAFFN